MRVVICENKADAIARVVARVADRVTRTPNCVLGLATGGTFINVYEGLVQRHKDGLSFRGVRTFNLDEYVGLPADHPQSYHHYMRKHLFDHVDIPLDATHIPDGMADPLDASRDFEKLIKDHGPIDLQLLGLGHNGHIGFNEPGSSLGSRTREKTLTRQTQEMNARFFGSHEHQPVSAITMGIATILDAKSIALLAVGAEKAQAVSRVVEGPMTAMCPGSALQAHPHVTVYVDPAAAAQLVQQDQYMRAEEIQAARLSCRGMDDR